MTEEDLTELERLASATTAGPWFVVSTLDERGDYDTTQWMATGFCNPYGYPNERPDFQPLIIDL